MERRTVYSQDFDGLKTSLLGLLMLWSQIYFVTETNILESGLKNRM
jgi:hypothetical protein